MTKAEVKVRSKAQGGGDGLEAEVGEGGTIEVEMGEGGVIEAEGEKVEAS